MHQLIYRFRIVASFLLFVLRRYTRLARIVWFGVSSVVVCGTLLFTMKVLRELSSQPQEEICVLKIDQEQFELLDQDLSGTASKSGAPVSSESGQIVVSISGAVKKTGVFELPTGSRLADGVTKAGGFHADADMVWIGQHINLAEKVQDEQHEYFPFIGELQKDLVDVNDNANEKTNENNAELNDSSFINTATEQELMDIDGIGEARAMCIISNRPYVSFAQLQSNCTVPKATLDLLLQK
ncbi:MAG: ComEA family protein/general secretion pathway protein K [Microgenomates group bacterium GW2011_GWF2_45_18]|nr:MAG: ComEA family protein/general secretion pathway protein K [Microgenomates group bacterium GW2011_GWF1_44_10]KKU01399.1 MAG: ComEA family protein/general secretion pathway protein K [Microgenomates group bacterium GW2011_GWF2_45_18]